MLPTSPVNNPVNKANNFCHPGRSSATRFPRAGLFARLDGFFIDTTLSTRGQSFTLPMIETTYAKLFSSLVTSTIWREDDKTRIVWITMLALKNRHGDVAGSIPGLAAMANVAVDDCVKALEKLKAPDPFSRSKEFEGCRISEIEGGWHILNHKKYRAAMSEQARAEYKRIWQAAYRKRKSVDKNVDMKMSMPTQAEAEAEAEAKTEVQKKKEPFRVPTIEAVKLLVAKSGLPDSEAERFWNYYESNGWRVGRNPMRSLEAAVGHWKSNYETYRRSSPKGPDRNAGTRHNHSEYAAAAARKVARDREAMERKVANLGNVEPRNLPPK